MSHKTIQSPQFDSDPVRVTPQLHAIPDGAHFIKDDTQNDFSSAARYIDQLPQGATAVWQDNADNWKNNVGNFTKTAVVNYRMDKVQEM